MHRQSTHRKAQHSQSVTMRICSTFGKFFGVFGPGGKRGGRDESGQASLHFMPPTRQTTHTYALPPSLPPLSKLHRYFLVRRLHYPRDLGPPYPRYVLCSSPPPPPPPPPPPSPSSSLPSCFAVDLRPQSTYAPLSLLLLNAGVLRLIHCRSSHPSLPPSFPPSLAWSTSNEPTLTVDGQPTSVLMRMGPFGMKARVSQVRQRTGRVGKLGLRVTHPFLPPSLPPSPPSLLGRRPRLRGWRLPVVLPD